MKKFTISTIVGFFIFSFIGTPLAFAQTASNTQATQLVQLLTQLKALLAQKLLLTQTQSTTLSVYTQGKAGTLPPIHVLPTRTASTDQLTQLTVDVLNANNVHRVAVVDKKSAAYARLKDALEVRRTAQIAAMERNPRVVLNTAISKQLGQRFPVELQVYLEQPVVLDGTFASFIAEDATSGYEEYFHTLVDDTGSEVRLRTSNGFPEARSGEYVHVNGVKVNNEVAVSLLQVLH